MVRVAAAIVFTAIIAAAAFARTAAVVHEFERFGLFGVWAPNCAEPASPDNPRVTVGKGDHDTVLEQDEFGSGFEVNRYLIVAARRMSGHRLAVDALFQQDEAAPQRQLIVMRVEGRTRRTLFTGTGDEPPLVKDGIAVAIGKPTPTLNKCD